MIFTTRAIHQAARLGGRNFVGKLPVTTGAPRRMLWTPTVASPSSLFAKTIPSFNRNATQRFVTTVAAPEAITSGGRSSRTNLALGLVGGLVLAGVHSATGSQADFFEYRFTTQKSADDLATFYGGEEFMERK